MSSDDGSDAAEEDCGENEEVSWSLDYAPPPKFEEPPFDSPRFQVGDPAALEYLRDNGYTIFASVLSPQDVETATELFWSFLEEATRGGPHEDGASPVLRNDPETWASRRWPGQSSNGLIGAPGIGQSPLMWFVRQQPAVLRAFADIWGVKDPGELVVSFDGAGAFRPEAQEPAWRTRGGWFHTDQNGRTTGSDFTCAQGLVSLTDASATTGGLALLPGSHLRHHEIFERWPLRRANDFFVLPRTDPLLRAPVRLVRLRAGDLAIWDSRCVHCNVPARHRFDEVGLSEALDSVGLAEVGAPLLRMGLTSVADACFLFHRRRANSEAELEALLGNWGIAPESAAPLAKAVAAWAQELDSDLQAQGDPQRAGSLQRAVAYVCLMPRARVSDEALTRRVDAALMGGTTTHWPDKCLVHTWQTTAKNLRFVLHLGEKGLRLIGCSGSDLDEMRMELDHAWGRIHEAVAARKAAREAVAEPTDSK